MLVFMPDGVTLAKIKNQQCQDSPFPTPEMSLPTISWAAPKAADWIMPPIIMMMQPQMMILRRPHLFPIKEATMHPTKQPMLYNATIKPRKLGLGLPMALRKLGWVTRPPNTPYDFLLAVNMSERSTSPYLIISKQKIGASSTECDCPLEVLSTQFGKHVDAPSVTGTRRERNAERVWQLT